MFGVIADDLTGANDVGAMFNRAGLTVQVMTQWQKDNGAQESCTEQVAGAGPENEEKVMTAPESPAGQTPNQQRGWRQGRATPEGDVVVLDTNSRCDTPEVAYRKVCRATKLLKSWGCTRFYKKICSAFRGNVGAELDALLDMTGEKFLPLVVAFPENGRTTRNGLHYIWGTLLAESEFKNDPIHPMTESDLVKVLQDQTRRPVGLIDWKTVETGVEACCRALKEAQSRGGYVIIDALTSRDLLTIAAAAKQIPVAGGSSALGQHLGRFLQAKVKKPDVRTVMENWGCGILTVAGSVTPQTRAQIERACQSGIFGYSLDATQLLTVEGRQAGVREAVSNLAPRICQGEDVILYTSHGEEAVQATLAAGKRLGLEPAVVGRRISRALAEITAGVAGATGLQQLIICGGETAGAISQQLGIRGMTILEEVEPGVPSGLSFGDRQLLTVLKAGGFGTDEFILKAMRHLRRFAC